MERPFNGKKSVSHQRFIKVQDRVGHEHPGGQIRLVEVAGHSL